MTRGWIAVGGLLAAALAGCSMPGGGDDADRPYSTWPEMSVEVLSADLGDAPVGCPPPRHTEGSCRSLAMQVRIRNLGDLPVLLDDVWIAGNLTGGGVALPPSPYGDGASLAPSRARTYDVTWTLAPDQVLSEVVLQHVRLYYDSHGEVPVRVIAHAPVPAYS